MVLNMAQTWHQLRPGEVRNNCGGCHAHSQKPTDFKQTAAAKADYQVWDLVNTTPLVTDEGAATNRKTEVGREGRDRPALRARRPVNVEYYRDIQPILQTKLRRLPHAKDGKKPAGNLDLDADDEMVSAEHHGKFPGTYYRLAMDERGKFGHKPVGWDSWGYPERLALHPQVPVAAQPAGRGRSTANGSTASPTTIIPPEPKPGDSATLVQAGKEVDLQEQARVRPRLTSAARCRRRTR